MGRCRRSRGRRSRFWGLLRCGVGYLCRVSVGHRFYTRWCVNMIIDGQATLWWALVVLRWVVLFRLCASWCEIFVWMNSPKSDYYKKMTWDSVTTYPKSSGSRIGHLPRISNSAAHARCVYKTSQHIITISDNDVNDVNIWHHDGRLQLLYL